jgi:catechol-2,3-dioxygenase
MIGNRVEGVSHLDHFALPAMDVDRAERFYTEILNGRVITRDSHGPGGVFIKFGVSHHIGLFGQSKAALPKRDTLDSFPRCAFVVPGGEFQNIAGKIQQTKSLMKEIGPRGDSADSRLNRGLTFTDSEGNLVEVFKGDNEKSSQIHHLHFDTEDMEKSIRFYTAVMGLELSERRNGVAVLQIPSKQCLVLHQMEKLSEVTKTPYEEMHYAFFVSDDNFGRIINRLHAEGIPEIHDIGQGAVRKPGDLATYFRDPVTGLCLQILNRDSAYFCQKFGFNVA